MFEKYADYGAEDFVRDDGFIKWVLNPEQADDLFWTDFLGNFPYKRNQLNQAKQQVLNLKNALDDEPGNEATAEIWTRLESSMGPKVMPLWNRRWLTGAVAAAVLLLSVLGLWNVTTRQKALQTGKADFFETILAGEQMKEIGNNTGKPMLVRLPDESRVTLHAGGRLRYDPVFNRSTREVYLSGEAFFEVTHNAERPFMVYANGLITKVLGTSFSVKADKGDQKVTVMVKTGKVAVFADRKASSRDPETEGIVLRPNEQAAYQVNTEKLTRSLVPEPAPLVPETEFGQVQFVDKPVTEIFAELQKAYGIEIIYDNELLKGCRLTSSLGSGASLFDKLTVLCEAIGASYKVVDAHIIINGKKCS
ncbi:FecR family protein [Dyadobacter sp. SG02]|uniref:FecR family protein n=1 Tax=Dyadobacter sp. SG02 TaxID=1855291 RepID=UPI0008D651AC|nr:FecR family protein [Dyadobacter sp. SG02]SEJ16119.1 FecR family protein [Dyadobacter sp. SG02]